MPVYCYHCKKCDHHFEEMKPVDKRYDIECPECGAREDVDIVPSTTAFILRGSGWSKDS